MRSILMKGHQRPLTFLSYNRDDNLLFSGAKDHNPTYCLILRQRRTPRHLPWPHRCRLVLRRLKQALALTLVSIGVTMATMTDLQFHFFGACVALAWIVPSAINKILWSRLQQLENWTTLA
ncbi:translation initiation factor 3 subunit I [Vigna unguiculata]|uniref:Translation initiation factor 3 subunit I n=1 Tax=Vigna unguiculata TaxID=3917 RepID=A0A4D6NNW2_VIGUN|nr:translation initiation factor 3 subunit I [Vigna unguiculata]